MLFKKILRWAKITKAGSDDKQFPSQQLEYMGKVADTTMVTPFGYHANATPDFLALMGAVGGDPDNRVVVGGVAVNRPKLAEGEVAFYHPATGGFIIWRANGNLEINAGTKDINVIAANVNMTAAVKVTIDTPEAQFTGKLQVDGDFNNDGTATLGGAGGAAIARVGDAVSGGVITGGSATHTAT